jgi:hypothetical protein
MLDRVAAVGASRHSSQEEAHSLACTDHENEAGPLLSNGGLMVRQSCLGF